MQPIDIVMTTWKREAITELSLLAFKKNTTTPYRLIIIDNGSSKASQIVYNRYADVYIRLDDNKGLEYAKWLGMEFVKSDLFVSTDNDILPYFYTPDWLSQLRDLMTKNPEYAAIALRPQVLVGTGNIFEGKTEDVVEFSHVPGYARIMRTNLVKQCGAWNEKRALRGHEEYWISERLHKMGFKTGFANHIECWHLFGNENTDKWGYEKDSKPEDHGHNDVSGLPGNDAYKILENVGIDIWGTQ